MTGANAQACVSCGLYVCICLVATCLSLNLPQEALERQVNGEPKFSHAKTSHLPEDCSHSHLCLFQMTSMVCSPDSTQAAALPMQMTIASSTGLAYKWRPTSTNLSHNSKNMLTLRLSYTCCTL